MTGPRALVVHASEDIAVSVAEALRGLGIASDSVTTAGQALASLESTPYRAVLLDDELPDTGSLLVFELLGRLAQAPEVLLVMVPDAELIPEQDGVDYILTPITPSQVQALAMRVRSQLMNVGLADDFGVAQAAKRAAARISAGSQARRARVRLHVQPGVAAAAVVLTLAGLVLILQ